MGGAMKNSALNVKIHGKLKNRLTNDMYGRMTTLKSVPDVAKFLKEETSYARMLPETDVSEIHRGYLEKILTMGLSRDIRSLSSFMNISETAFMRLFEIREDMENIKVFLRYLCANHVDRFIPAAIFGGSGKIDFQRLAVVKNFDEFLSVIDDTIYAKPLKGFSGYEERPNIFDMENSLNAYYNSLVFKYAKKYLSPAEFETVKETHGSEADLFTIMFIIRAKKNFNIPVEQLYPYIKHKYAHLNEETVTEMVNAKSAEEVYEILKGTKYYKIFADGSAFIERRIEKYISDLHAKMFRKAQYSIEAVLYYVNVREVELRNIVTIIEGIRYGLEPSVIKQYLIGIDMEERR